MTTFKFKTARYQANAFPAALRAASFVLSAFVVGAILFQTASVAAAIII